MLWMALWGLAFGAGPAGACASHLRAPVLIAEAIPRVDLRRRDMTRCWLAASATAERGAACVLTLDGQDRVLVVRVRMVQTFGFAQILKDIFGDRTVEAQRRWAARAEDALATAALETFSTDTLAGLERDPDKLNLLDDLFFMRFSATAFRGRGFPERLALITLLPKDPVPTRPSAREGAVNFYARSAPAWIRHDLVEGGHQNIYWDVYKTALPQVDVDGANYLAWLKGLPNQLPRAGISFGSGRWLVAHARFKRSVDLYEVGYFAHQLDRDTAVIARENLSFSDRLWVQDALVTQNLEPALDLRLQDHAGETVWVPRVLTLRAFDPLRGFKTEKAVLAVIEGFDPSLAPAAVLAALPADRRRQIVFEPGPNAARYVAQIYRSPNDRLYLSALLKIR